MPGWVIRRTGVKGTGLKDRIGGLGRGDVPVGRQVGRPRDHPTSGSRRPLRRRRGRCGRRRIDPRGRRCHAPRRTGHIRRPASHGPTVLPPASPVADGGIGPSGVLGSKGDGPSPAAQADHRLAAGAGRVVAGPGRPGGDAGGRRGTRPARANDRQARAARDPGVRPPCPARPVPTKGAVAGEMAALAATEARRQKLKGARRAVVEDLDGAGRGVEDDPRSR
jgi:hypothetical protein